jgi:membrane associated rhomboid family serine protease
MPSNPRYSTMAYSFGPGPITPAVKILLYVNIGAYLASLFYSPILDWFGLQPQDVVEKYRLWQPVTYMFLHARGPSHILFNMLILWMFGVELERTWGTPFFVKYYFVTGVGAGLVSIAACFLPFQATHALYVHNIVGASGALFGLLLAYAVYWPNRPILMFLFFPVPAKYFVMILGAINLIMTVDGGGGVATITHLGGLAVGYIYLQSGRGGLTAEIKYRYLKWRMNRMRRKFDVYSGGRSDKSNWDRHVH